MTNDPRQIENRPQSVTPQWLLWAMACVVAMGSVFVGMLGSVASAGPSQAESSITAAPVVGLPARTGPGHEAVLLAGHDVGPFAEEAAP